MGVRSSFIMARSSSRFAPAMASHFARMARQSGAMAKHRWLRRTLGLGLLAGAAYAVWRTIDANRVEHDAGWEPQPFPFPPQPRTEPRTAEHAEGEAPAAPAGEREPWVAPTGDACPASHPVKVKLSSRIFHVPGGLSYDRTVPDRCYVDASAAEHDGFRAAKR